MHPIARPVASAPEGTRGHVVPAHRTRHPSAGVVRVVAEPDQRPDDWGPKGTRGMRRTRSPRAAFLAAPTPRLVFHSTPTQASGMHHMALWFSIVVRKLLQRASGTAVED